MTGNVKNGILEILFKDRIKQQRVFTTRIGANGTYQATKRMWGVYPAGVTNITITGEFRDSTFTAKLTPSSNGIGCRAKLILLPGTIHFSKKWEDLEVEHFRLKALSLASQTLRSTETETTETQPIRQISLLKSLPKNSGY